MVSVSDEGDIGKENDRCVLQSGVKLGLEGAPSLIDVVDVDEGSSHSISVGNPKAVIKGADTTGVE